MLAPLAHYAGCGWVAMLWALLTFLPLCLLIRPKKLGRGLAFLEWLWLIAVLSRLLPNAASYWLGGGKTVPLTLLVLAAWGVKGDAPVRGGNVIFWLILPILGIVALLAIPKVEPMWLTGKTGDWSSGLMVALLIPALVRRSGDVQRKGIAMVGITAIGLSLLIQGCLSLPVAGETAPFYLVGRTIGGGVEILVSVAMTLSWYALSSLMISCGTELLKETGIPGEWGRWITALFAGIVIVIGYEIKGMILVAGTIFMWFLIPILSPEK